MHKIQDELLWIGHALDVRDARVLFAQGIEAVVDVAYEEPPAALPRSIVYCRFPLVDGKGNDPQRLRLVIDTTIRLLRASVPTLLACSAGMSRSLGVAAVVLATLRDRPLDQSLVKVSQEGPHDLSLAFWNELVQVWELGA